MSSLLKNPGQRLSTNSALEARAPAPRLRIRLDLDDKSNKPHSSPESHPPAPDRRKLKTLTFGSISIPYGEYRSGRVRYWMLFYYDNGRRIRESRSSFAALKARAEEVATSISNGQTAMSQFTENDRASYRRACELAQSVGAPIELLVAEAVEARKKNAVRFVGKTCPDLVALLLETKRKEGKCGKRWLRGLEEMLDRLATFYTGPLHLLRAHDLNAWLRSLPGGLVYRRHHRAAAIQLVRFAQANNHVPRDWDELSLVDDPEPPPVKIRIWTPDQLVKLLSRTLSNMIPFTVLQSFAGIRHEELNPEECEVDKRPLDWLDFDWKEKLIEITEDTGKTGARLVPMSDNLVAWLKPHAKPRGPVCELSNTSNALWRAKKRAGLPTGKNESRNVLRKSFGSYRLAVVKHIGQVADEMGNSPAKIKSNYRKPRSEAEGKRWFAIWPTNAEVLQLNFKI